MAEDWNLYKKMVADEMVEGDTPLHMHDNDGLSFRFHKNNVEPKLWVTLTGKSQEAKADAGKAPLSMVPLQLLEDISWVRKYGNLKYGDPENWKLVDPKRYVDAAFRHLVAYIRDPYGLDEESGLPHLWHLECNIAFLAELEHKKFDKKKILENMRNWGEQYDE